MAPMNLFKKFTYVGTYVHYWIGVDIAGSTIDSSGGCLDSTDVTLDTPGVMSIWPDRSELMDQYVDTKTHLSSLILFMEGCVVHFHPRIGRCIHDAE